MATRFLLQMCRKLRLLAINLFTGKKKLPSYRDHWSSRRTMQDLFVFQVMLLHRFWSIAVNPPPEWQYSNVTTRFPKYPQTLQTAPIFRNTEVSVCRKLSTLEKPEYWSSMIRFKGRCSFKQNMPTNPSKGGCKVCVGVDDLSYICQFEVYTEKQSTTSSECGLGQRVSELTMSLKRKKVKYIFS